MSIDFGEIKAMIIFDARRVKAYEALQEVGKQSGKEVGFLDGLWTELCADEELFTEFVYYLENHSIKDEIKCEGYGLTDLYFYLMRRYEVGQDIGKNYADCDKEALVLDTFDMMAQMKKDPDPVIKRLNEGLGMDKLF